MINIEYLEKIAYEKYAANVLTSIIKNVGKPIAGALARVPVAMSNSAAAGYLQEGARFGAGLQLAGLGMQGKLMPSIKNRVSKLLSSIGIVKKPGLGDIKNTSISIPAQSSRKLPQNKPRIYSPQTYKKFTSPAFYQVSSNKTTKPVVQRIGEKLENVGGNITHTMLNEENLFNRDAAEIARNAVNTIGNNLSPKKYKIIKSNGLVSDSLTGSELKFTGKKTNYADQYRRGLLDDIREAGYRANEKPVQIARNNVTNTDPFFRKQHQEALKERLKDLQFGRRHGLAVPVGITDGDMVAYYKSIKRHGLASRIFDTNYNGNKLFSSEKTKNIQNQRQGTFSNIINTAKIKVEDFFHGSRGNRNFEYALYTHDPKVFLRERHQNNIKPQINTTSQWKMMRQPLEPNTPKIPRQQIKINPNRGEMMSNTN